MSDQNLPDELQFKIGAEESGDTPPPPPASSGDDMTGHLPPGFGIEEDEREGSAVQVDAHEPPPPAHEAAPPAQATEPVAQVDAPPSVEDILGDDWKTSDAVQGAVTPPVDTPVSPDPAPAMQQAAPEAPPAAQSAPSQPHDAGTRQDRPDMAGTMPPGEKKGGGLRQGLIFGVIAVLVIGGLAYKRLQEQGGNAGTGPEMSMSQPGPAGQGAAGMSNDPVQLAYELENARVEIERLKRENEESNQQIVMLTNRMNEMKRELSIAREQASGAAGIEQEYREKLEQAQAEIKSLRSKVAQLTKKRKAQAAKAARRNRLARYRVIGTIATDDGLWMAQILSGNTLHDVRAGQMIEGVRIDEIGNGYIRVRGKRIQVGSTLARAG